MDQEPPPQITVRGRVELAVLLLLLASFAYLQSDWSLGKIQLAAALRNAPATRQSVVQVEVKPRRSLPASRQPCLAEPTASTEPPAPSAHNASSAPETVRVLKDPVQQTSPNPKPTTVTGRPAKRPRPRVPLADPSLLELPTELMHVVTIGDSVTRYQYIDLVWGLHTGSPIPAPEKLTWEAGHASWPAFYETTTGAFGGHMKCDCYRSQNIPCFAELCVENRFYKHPTAPLWMTHLQLFGDVAMTARVPLNNSQSAQITAAQGTMYYATDLVTVLKDHLRYMNPPPTHIVINVGFWNHGALTGRIADFIAAARAITPRLVWKATSLPQFPSNWLPNHETLTNWNQYRHPHRDIDVAMKDHYCGLRKSCHFLPFPGPPLRPPSDYIDNVHLKSSTYREWNLVMWKFLMMLNSDDAVTEAPLVAT